jgi:hypothetical protein
LQITVLVYLALNCKCVYTRTDKILSGQQAFSVRHLLTAKETTISHKLATSVVAG